MRDFCSGAYRRGSALSPASEGVLVEVLNLIMDLGAMPTDDLGDFAVAHGHCVVELPSLRSPLERVGGENLAEEEREARRMGFGED